MQKWIILAGVVVLASAGRLAAQSATVQTYHDKERNNIKEVYQVKDTVSDILHGKYVSYYLNGNIESKGQFVNNETTGPWEFYYETGNLRMKGILRQNVNLGVWEFYYENGVKSMEGIMNGRNRDGEWKIYYESGELKERGDYVNNKRQGLWITYFEDGTRRGEIEYKDDYGRYQEYAHDGHVIAEGPRTGVRNVGHWRFYIEGNVLQAEGDYDNGLKAGEWKTYFPSGKTASTGRYEHDEPVGTWVYYFDDGTISSSGSYVGGKRDGYWSAMNPDGSLKSEITYVNGIGEYREYFAGAGKKLRAKGQIMNDQRDGNWQFYAITGKLEGECEYSKGKGVYKGYYPNGALQTKGAMENHLRVGTWELYEPDGNLSGYYKPFYENNQLAGEINSILNKTRLTAPTVRQNRRQGFYYFQPRFPEYRSVILGSNPMMTFLGRLPLDVEFYNQERLGHEFEFEGLRSPFFTSDAEVPQGTVYERGYSIAVKEKFYNVVRSGMWYFGHEIRFTNIGYFNNVMFPQSPTTLITASASEQRAEYGIMLGARLMQQNNSDGFTIDFACGYNIGYRMFDVEPLFESAFKSVNQESFYNGFRFTINFGYSFSFEGR